jgi:hypothetical protein
MTIQKHSLPTFTDCIVIDSTFTFIRPENYAKGNEEENKSSSLRQPAEEKHYSSFI